MNEFMCAIGGGCIGAALAILGHRAALENYYALVESLWNNDLKRINNRIDDLSPTYVHKPVCKFKKTL